MNAYQDLAKKIRLSALAACRDSGSSHIGSCLSCADLLAVLYGGWLRVSPGTQNEPERDRFILSKGHAAAAMYSTLCAAGFIPGNVLSTYGKSGSPLGGHVHSHVDGVEVSTGSLGHGLPLGSGMALGLRRAGRKARVVVLMSDGELDSGANWEAFMFAASHGLGNLVAIIDRNRLQAMGLTEDIMPLEPLEPRFEAFGWTVRRVDGHDHGALEQALNSMCAEGDKPLVIIADTVKGKGVSFMENEVVWHYRSPDAQACSLAMEEIRKQ